VISARRKSYFKPKKRIGLIDCLFWILKNATFLGAVLFSLSVHAQTPQLFGSTGLDPSFCQQKTFRQTVVYVDMFTLQQGQTSWAVDLEGKLKATLTPGERVTVVELAPNNGTSQEIWSQCYPDYSPEKRAELSKQTFFFSSNPLNGLKAQQGFFMNGFGSAITQIFQDAAKNNHATIDDATQPQTDELIEALASDGARFSQSPETVRAIVYSNLAQNSSIGDVFKDATNPPTDVGRKLGTYFRHSVFYFFGVGIGVSNDGTYLADSKTFWTSVMNSMDSPVEGFGSDLNVPNEVPIGSYQYVLNLTFNGVQLFGKASLLVDSDGNLIDSWIGVTRLAFVGISGTFVCSGPDNTDCSLDANTNGGLTTKSSSEDLSLTGNDSSTLKGTDGVPGAITFPLTATLKNE
jgi:hypothetical protein